VNLVVFMPRAGRSWVRISIGTGDFPVSEKVKTVSGAKQSSIRYLGFFPWVNRQGREVDH
jgi:hypothetical protein